MTIEESASPCYKCGVNSWTSCKHRTVERTQPDIKEEVDKAEVFRKASGGGRYTIKPSAGNSVNFKRLKSGRISKYD